MRDSSSIYFKQRLPYELKAAAAFDVPFKFAFTGAGGLIKCDKGLMTIYPGYEWDGPSGPTIDDRCNMRGSLYHDAFYQLMGEDNSLLKYRSHCDKKFRKILRKDGMSRFRAWYYYRAVKRFGKKYAKSPEAPRPVLRAP